MAFLLRFSSRLLLAATLCAATLASRPALAAPPYATDRGAYEASYLRAEDYPGGSVQLTQSSLDLSEPDPAFAQNGGVYQGLQVWSSPDNNADIGRSVDIRLVFPDAARARAYLEAELGRSLSEGQPPISQPPTVAQDSALFGQAGEMFGMFMVSYILVFRVENVVVKIFATQGAEVNTKRLTPLMMAALGQKAVARIQNSTGAAPAYTPTAPIEPQPTPSEPTPSEPVQVEPEPPAAPEEPVAPYEPDEPDEPDEPRPRGRLAQDVRDYWDDGLDDGILYLGGAYSSPLEEQHWLTYPLEQKSAWAADLSVLVHPRVYIRVQFHRERWKGPTTFNVLARRLELIYGLDLLAMPPKWRVRPALMGLVGLGIGWAYARLPADPLIAYAGYEDAAIGAGVMFGGEGGFHVRITEKFELALRGGVTRAIYGYKDGFPVGEKGYPRAWRWHAGLAFGFEVD